MAKNLTTMLVFLSLLLTTSVLAQEQKPGSSPATSATPTEAAPPTSAAPALAKSGDAVPASTGAAAASVAADTPVAANNSTPANGTPTGAPTSADASMLPATSDNAGNPATSPVIDDALLPHDLSPWGMFQNADIVVQVVMGGLAFASVVTWTVFLAKAWQLLWLNRQMAGALRRLEVAPSLDGAQNSVAQRNGLAPGLLLAALTEIDLSGRASVDGIKERVASRLERLAALMARNMNRGTGILATIGSTAPFVGLFGTVWGIMNSFIGISQAHTTNLAVVAPGIAEALLATAIGLVAAIPAVVVYNVLARGIAANKAVVADMTAAVMRLVSRDLDHDRVALSRAA